MKRIVVASGRLSDSTHVELHEPVTDLEGEVEVVLRPAKAKPQTGESIFDLIARLPGGTRSKEDIDRQIREERGSWAIGDDSGRTGALCGEETGEGST